MIFGLLDLYFKINKDKKEITSLMYDPNHILKIKKINDEYYCSMFYRNDVHNEEDKLITYITKYNEFYGIGVFSKIIIKEILNSNDEEIKKGYEELVLKWI
jgi:hypothetical protein